MHRNPNHYLKAESYKLKKVCNTNLSRLSYIIELSVFEKYRSLFELWLTITDFYFVFCVTNCTKNLHNTSVILCYGCVFIQIIAYFILHNCDAMKYIWNSCSCIRMYDITISFLTKISNIRKILLVWECWCLFIITFNVRHLN